MFKRATALFFILIASIVLLAHAVIPHHDYQNKICLTGYECETKGDLQNPLVPEPKHKDDSEKPTEHCVLADLLIISSDEKTQDFKASFFIENPSTAKIFHVSYLERDFSSNLIPLSGSTFEPLIVSAYSLCSSAIFGLRAPPIA